MSIISPQSRARLKSRARARACTRARIFVLSPSTSDLDNVADHDYFPSPPVFRTRVSRVKGKAFTTLRSEVDVDKTKNPGTGTGTGTGTGF